MHTGSHKLNNALGQCLLAKRMGKPRIIAETGAGPARRRDRDGVRAARAGVRRLHGHRGHAPQKPNVQRMRLLGATVSGVDAGSRTLKEAVSPRSATGSPTSPTPTTRSARASARPRSPRSCATCSA
jgi:tryptophan synthase beta chain